MAVAGPTALSPTPDRTDRAPMGTRHSHAAIGDLEQRLETWVRHGLITPEQASNILAVEHGADLEGVRPTAPETEPWGPRRPASTTGVSLAGAGLPPTSLVAEALGYVGGILIVIAAGAITGQYFDDLGRPGRLALTGSAALALLCAGYLVHVNPARPAAGRLRSVLWVLTVAATAFFISLLADETFGWNGEEVAFVAASGAAAVGLELWRRHRWMLQQLAVVVTLAVALGSGVAAYLGGDVALSGMAIWGLGGSWLMLGWAGHVQPRHGTDLLGGAAATVGSQLIMNYDWGAALALATAAALVAIGVRLRALVLLAVGSVATLLVVPGVMQRYFPDTLAAPLAVLGAGVVLVFAALATATKWRRHNPPKRERAPLSGLGWMPIVGFAVGVACGVVLLSLT